MAGEPTPNADEAIIANHLANKDGNQITQFLQRLKAKLGDDEAAAVILSMKAAAEETQ